MCSGVCPLNTGTYFSEYRYIYYWKRVEIIKEFVFVTRLTFFLIRGNLHLS